MEPVIRNIDTADVVVIGGINMDISGRPDGRLILRDSNPGRVSMHAGGVGRNIAHDLCLLGVQTSLIAPLGDDVYGRMLLHRCKEIGLDMSMAPILSDRRTSVYLYLADEKGDMLSAVSDMEITASLTPELLEPLLPRINAAKAVVMEANLSEETLLFLAENCTVPLYADCVSTGKAERLHAALPRLTCLKPNALEAEKLTGITEPRRAVRALLDAGVQRVFLSLGAGGMIASDGTQVLSLPCEQAQIRNTTGAGDAVTAAIVYAGVMGLGLESSLRLALKAGALTCACEGANSTALKELRL